MERQLRCNLERINANSRGYVEPVSMLMPYRWNYDNEAKSLATRYQRPNLPYLQAPTYRVASTSRNASQNMTSSLPSGSANYDRLSVKTFDCEKYPNKMC